jgi:copper oxidase (laccase) domain-containing protein
MKNAAGATIRHMVTDLGCQPQNIIVVVGPAIGPCCYDVGPDVMQAAARAFDEPEPLFSRRNGNPNRAHFDLWMANQQQLAATGVKHIVQSELCTACRTDQFFSHRAEKGRTGRFGVIIGLKGGRA